MSSDPLPPTHNAHQKREHASRGSYLAVLRLASPEFPQVELHDISQESLSRTIDEPQAPCPRECIHPHDPTVRGGWRETRTNDPRQIGVQGEGRSWPLREGTILAIV